MPRGKRDDPTIDEIIEELEKDPRVTTNDDGTRTVSLSEPIDVRRKGKRETEEVFELIFRKPRGADWLKMDEHDGDTAKGFCLAASLSGLPFKAFADMDGDDALLCVKVAGSMGKKLETGESSSQD